MSQIDIVAEARKNFPHREEDNTIGSLIGKRVDGALESGSRFWGTLESFDEKWLYIRGHRGQPILIKRRKLAALMEAI
jgi:hypothetical protein